MGQALRFLSVRFGGLNPVVKAMPWMGPAGFVQQNRSLAITGLSRFMNLVRKS